MLVNDRWWREGERRRQGRSGHAHDQGADQQPEQTRPNATGRLPSLTTPQATSKDSTGEVHTVVLVEASVLHCDERSREVLAEVVFADRQLVLGGFELAYLVAEHVVDGGVLDEVRVPALEPVLIDVDYVGLETRDYNQNADDEDYGEVKEEPQEA